MASQNGADQYLQKLSPSRIILGGFLIGLSVLGLLNFKINSSLKQSFGIIREPVTSSIRSTAQAVVDSNDIHSDGVRQLVVIYKDSDGEDETEYIDIAGFRHNDSTLSQLKTGDKLEIAYYNNGSSGDPYPSQFNGKSEYIKSVLSDNSFHSYVFYPILAFLMLALGILSFLLGTVKAFNYWSWTKRILLSLLASASIVLIMIAII